MGKGKHKPSAHRLLLKKRSLRTSLLRCYGRHRRRLPWREDADPYRILVAEFMLQQTRVETVIPYYQRFLRRFPTLAALDGASLQEVLRNWAGLGYYARPAACTPRRDFGIRMRIRNPLPAREHGFTHLEIIMQPYLCSLAGCPSPVSPRKNVRWVRPSGFSRYPISTAMRKICALL